MLITKEMNERHTTIEEEAKKAMGALAQVFGKLDFSGQKKIIDFLLDRFVLDAENRLNEAEQRAEKIHMEVSEFREQVAFARNFTGASPDIEAKVKSRW